MKKSPLINKKVPKLWQTYLDNIHQAQEVEQDSQASKKFWKKYEALVQQSKPTQKVSLPQVKKAREVKKTYDDIFLQYWNGGSSTVTYEQKIAKSNWMETVGCWPYFIALGCLLTSFIFSIAGNTELAGVFMWGFFGLALFTLLLMQLTKEASVPQTVHTTEYNYKFFVDHLLFTKTNRYKRTIRLKLEYHKIKSIQFVQGELKLKAMYHQSRSKKVRNKAAIKHFIVFKQVKNYDQIFNFLRDVAIHNKS